MKTLTTITGKEIKVASNLAKRTFTIKTSGGKFRTIPMSKSEFNSALNWTGNDWMQFLKTDEYYTV